MGGGAGASNPPPANPSPAAAGFRVDRALQALGFEFTRVTAEEVVGRLPVTETCCQPFDWLNGGVSALMAEVTASIGCYVASGYRRLAGVQLSINHVGPARLGDTVQARATPIQLGRKIQDLMMTASVAYSRDFMSPPPSQILAEIIMSTNNIYTNPSLLWDQVWEVQIWQIDPSTSERKDLVSTARVTLLANLSTPDKMKSFEQGLKKFSSKL